MVPVLMDFSNNQRYTFWKPEEQKSVWQRIPATKAALKHAITLGAKYTTVAQFTTDGDGNPYHYYSPLYIDFDAESNLDEAIDDAIACINYLESEFGYPVDVLKIFLTGGRGEHIEIPAISFGAEDGDPNLIYIFKKIIETWPFATLDHAIYNQRRGRMWRLPNLVRPNGRFKVPISIHENRHMPRERLWALTEKPRYDFQFNPPEDYPVCEDLKLEFEMRKHQYYEKALNQTTDLVDNADLKKFFIDELPVCIMALLNTTGLSNSDDTNLNLTALTLARFYTDAGFSESNLLEDAEEFCETNFLDSAQYPDLGTKLQHLQTLYRYVAGHSPEHTFSCGFPRKLRSDGLIQFACDRCPVNKPSHDAPRARKGKSAQPFVLESGLALIDRKFIRTEPLVEEIIGANKKILLAASDNVGKSILAHQVAIALAVGLDKFLFFEIPKPRRVLYLNFEMSDEQFQDRHRLLCSVLPPDVMDRLQNFYYNTYQGTRSLFQDNWLRIRATIEKNPPFDLIIVDNLYACTGTDDESNKELKPLLSEIFTLGDLHGSTMWLITHDKKHGPDTMMSKNLIRGGSTIANSMDVILQMAMSLKSPGLRLIKITKNRDRSPNLQKTFGLKLDPENLWFHSVGPVQEAAHFKHPESLKGLELLSKMDDVFKTETWIKAVNSNFGKSRRTAFNWIEGLTDAGFVRFKSFGFHEKIQQEPTSG